MFFVQIKRLVLVINDQKHLETERAIWKAKLDFLANGQRVTKRQVYRMVYILYGIYYGIYIIWYILWYIYIIWYILWYIYYMVYHMVYIYYMVYIMVYILCRRWFNNFSLHYFNVHHLL